MPNGYTGEVYVTFDINQFTTTYDGEDMANFIGDLYASASTPQAGITTSQQTTVNTTRSKTQAGNKIYMTQSGSGIDLDIVQDGDDNLIIGTDLTNAATITGDTLNSQSHRRTTTTCWASISMATAMTWTYGRTPANVP